MFLKVPLRYQAEVLKPRCRNSEPMIFGEWLEVEVEEVSASDAPVAVRWIADASRHLRLTQASADMREPVVKETRWWEDSHYRPVFDVEDRAETNAFTRSTLIEACANGIPLAFALPMHNDHDIKAVVAGELRPIADFQFRKIENSTRDRAIADVTKRAADLLIINGEVWRKCAEPIYVVKQGVGLIVHIPSDNEDWIDPERQFRIDRLDDAIDHFDIDERWIRHRADVIFPDAIRFDDETPAMICACRKVVDRFRGTSLDKKPTEFLIAWAVLRDAVELAELGPTEDGMNELVAHLRNLVAVSESQHYHIKDMENSLDRWSLRPLGDSEHIADCGPLAP
jgi:hypothetical protein